MDHKTLQRHAAGLRLLTGGEPGTAQEPKPSSTTPDENAPDENAPDWSTSGDAQTPKEHARRAESLRSPLWIARFLEPTELAPGVNVVGADFQESRGANSALAHMGMQGGVLLARHFRGDWGFIGPEDWEANNAALRTGARIFSVYPVRRETDPCGLFLWVITEPEPERTKTTVMLAPDGTDEYVAMMEADEEGARH